MKVDALSFATRLLHPRHVVIVTCCDREGRANAITLAWSMPASFNPPMVVVSIAPARYSHRLIEETGEFVVNVPTVELLKQTYLVGSKSGRDVDKFKLTGLTPGKAKVVKPPIIEECIAHLECRVVNHVRAGDHTLFIGEVVAAYAEEEAFKDQLLNPKAAKPLFHYGLNYFTTIVDEVLKP
ncbi:MAG: flavin reductase family protein [Thermoprotei archaeon]|nr:MAG: flavin reductase family protein [Thermoprotei archaeon]